MFNDSPEHPAPGLLRHTRPAFYLAGLLVPAFVQALYLNDIDPRAYLDYALTHIADHEINRIDEFLPWQRQGGQRWGFAT